MTGRFRVAHINIRLCALLIGPLLSIGIVATYVITTFGWGIAGEVIDGQSSAPIADAYVQLTWDGVIGGMVHSSSQCVHTEVVQTDANGHFRTTPWIRMRRQQEIGFFDEGLKQGSLVVSGRIYKLGYRVERFDTRDDGNVYALARLNGSPHVLLGELAKVSIPSCNDRSEVSALPILRAVRAEVEEIPGGDSYPIGYGTLLGMIDTLICREKLKAKSQVHDPKEQELCGN